MRGREQSGTSVKDRYFTIGVTLLEIGINTKHLDFVLSSADTSIKVTLLLLTYDVHP